MMLRKYYYEWRMKIIMNAVGFKDTLQGWWNGFYKINFRFKLCKAISLWIKWMLDYTSRQSFFFCSLKMYNARKWRYFYLISCVNEWDCIWFWEKNRCKVENDKNISFVKFFSKLIINEKDYEMDVTSN